jgi:hypothetical protein
VKVRQRSGKDLKKKKEKALVHPHRVFDMGKLQVD